MLSTEEKHFPVKKRKNKTALPTKEKPNKTTLPTQEKENPTDLISQKDTFGDLLSQFLEPNADEILYSSTQMLALLTLNLFHPTFIELVRNAPTTQQYCISITINDPNLPLKKSTFSLRYSFHSSTPDRVFKSILTNKERLNVIKSISALGIIISPDKPKYL